MQETLVEEYYILTDTVAKYRMLKLINIVKGQFAAQNLARLKEKDVLVTDGALCLVGCWPYMPDRV